MRSEVRPPLTVEETGPQFNHCHISDIWNNMSGSGVWVGFVRLGLVRLGWVACPVGMGQGGMGHGSGRDGSGWGWVRWSKVQLFRECRMLPVCYIISPSSQV